MSGTYLPAVEPAQRLGQRLYRLKSAIAEVGLTEAVFVAVVVVAAELAQQHGTPQFILTVNVFLEVNVQALGLTDLLVVPAGGVVYRSCAVKVPDKLCDTGGVKLTPALVERYPHRDAGAVVELMQHLEKLNLVLLSARLVLSGEQLVAIVLEVDARHERGGDDDGVVLAAAVYHVLPHEHTEAVAVIVPAHGFDLYVLAQHIKAHVLCGLNVEDQRLVTRRGVHTVGPVALIQKSVVEKGLVVQKQAAYAVPVTGDGEFAHRKVAVHLVLAADDGEVVELRRVGRPRLKVRHRDAAGQGVALSVKYGICVRSSNSFGNDLNMSGVEIGRNTQVFDVTVRHALKPHGLPYAALWAVPYAAPLCALLASGVPAFVAHVLYTDAKLVFDGKQLSYIAFKRRVAADVMRSLHAVYIHRCGLIHRTEVQNDPTLVPRHLKLSAVPEVFVGLKNSAHAGQLALRGEGDEYLSVPRVGHGVRLRDCVIPNAVEINIAVPDELRTGVFLKHTVFVEFFPPNGKHGRTSEFQ